MDPPLNKKRSRGGGLKINKRLRAAAFRKAGCVKPAAKQLLDLVKERWPQTKELLVPAPPVEYDDSGAHILLTTAHFKHLESVKFAMGGVWHGPPITASRYAWPTVWPKCTQPTMAMFEIKVSAQKKHAKNVYDDSVKLENEPEDPGVPRPICCFCRRPVAHGPELETTLCGKPVHHGKCSTTHFLECKECRPQPSTGGAGATERGAGDKSGGTRSSLAEEQLRREGFLKLRNGFD